MADLHYFPLFASDWLSSEAITLMKPEQEGAFIRLLIVAWNSSELPCSLPNDEVTLAHLSRLGKRWKKLGPLVRAQFVEVEGDPTRLRNPKLWDVYVTSIAKHEKAVARGRAGGKAKAEGKQNPSIAIEQLEQNSTNHNHKEIQSQITTKTTTTTPPNPPTPQFVENSHGGGDVAQTTERLKSAAMRILSDLRRARREQRAHSGGVFYRIDPDVVRQLPERARCALDAIGGAAALAEADDVGLRILRSQFATAYAGGSE